MVAQQVKFYQTGSFVVGNRLLDPSQRSRSSLYRPGQLANDGSPRVSRLRRGPGRTVRCGRRDAGHRRPTGGDQCHRMYFEVVTTPYPESAWQVPWLHSLFGNAPAVAAGVAAALKVKGRTDIRVLGQAGDGGTVDIGFGCLSGMFERNDDVLFVCYDNQAYMNTGVQRSGATPPLARTTTTPVVGASTGTDFGQGKSAPLIAMAHEIPYVATATVADVRELEAKVHRAMALRGARYLHVLVPCPVGWGSAASDTIRVARLATESGLFPVFEAERGEVVGSTPIRHQVPVTDYLRLQARYSHLFAPEPRLDLIASIQARADRNIHRFRLLEGGNHD